jgi:hypothetical protein
MKTKHFDTDDIAAPSGRPKSLPQKTRRRNALITG